MYVGLVIATTFSNVTAQNRAVLINGNANMSMYANGSEGFIIIFKSLRHQQEQMLYNGYKLENSAQYNNKYSVNVKYNLTTLTVSKTVANDAGLYIFKELETESKSTVHLIVLGKSTRIKV